MSYLPRLNFIYLIFLSLVLSDSSAFYVANRLEEKPCLKRIILNGDSVIEIPSTLKERGIFNGNRLILENRNNNFTFELSANDTLEYRYFLNGFDSEWTPWKKTNYKEYTNIPTGNYSFQSNYRGPDLNIGEIAVFNLKVLPLWYFSLLAKFLYLILFSLIIWVLYAHLDLRIAGKLYMLEQIINKRTEDLIIEKEKTEELLANVLPKNTASEIIAKGKATKKTYNFVTVLFSDIQGFTKIAEEINTEVLIDELDKFFFHFDTVVEKYGIEKIKTIGDAYMCAGGIPEKNRTNPVEVILAALEMKAYMNELKETSELEGMKYWDIRVGIHTGTVVAGVIGQKKLSYDIWGDTVNTASRMESSGKAGEINISGITYEFVKDFFECEFRGKIPVKYKGEVEMYFVKGIVPGLRDKKGNPDKKFVLKMQIIKLKDIEEMVIKMFDEEAPPNLYFHNSALVRDINNKVELLSKAEDLPDEEFINISLAAVFLFTGFISDYEKPKEASLRLVEEILPRYGFNRGIIESVIRLINNSFTNLRESNSDNILHDARYDYFGREDYTRLTDLLLKERTEYGIMSDNITWIELQRKQLSEHDFITDSARHRRQVPLEVQVSRLQISGELSDL
jgi:adenylate cyclase